MAYSRICSADFNQAAECLPIDARGKQCVPCCLMFFIISHSRPCSSITSADMNDILFAGSNLYCKLQLEGHQHEYMEPQELPEYIVYNSNKFHVRFKDVLSGVLNDQSGNLETLLNNAFASSKNVIIIFNGVSLGLQHNDNCFYIFDSHSRDSNGMCNANGNGILGVVHGLEHLCSFLRSLSSSINCSDTVFQFDVHPLLIAKVKKSRVAAVEVFTMCLKKSKRNVGSCVSRANSAKKQKLSKSYSKSQILTSQPNFKWALDDRHVITEDIFSSQDQRQPHESASVTNSASNLNICKQFQDIVSSGPDYVCSSCTQTFFRHSVSEVSRVTCVSMELKSCYLTGYKSIGNKEWVCNTCKSSLSKGHAPSVWVNNGLKFPTRPEELNITNLEERLVSPRLPFMQLREMPRGGQVSLKGNIVNVPADVSSTIKSLPRLLNDNETILLKLKRKLSYKHHVAFENIRPNKVFAAAQWLVQYSQVFKNEGIVLNESWLDVSQHVENMDSSDTPESENAANENIAESDVWSEEEIIGRMPAGNFDTMLHPLDFREFNKILSVAPAENNSPIGLFQDMHSEVLSFPSIYCGQPRVENSQRVVPLHYSTICKWELRNVDRRVAQCLPNIFYKLKRLQIKQIKDKVTLAIRKCKTKGQVFTVGDILSPDFVSKLTMQDDGFRVLRTIRGSPPYWEQAKRDVLAMVRQLGVPTWFCSFSAAETKWMPLLKSLFYLKHGKTASNVEIEALSWQDKSNLIKSDPVTCARYFDFKVQAFIKYVLKSDEQPIGEIADFFYRVEFQQRGSPHIHMLIWVKNAPCVGSSTLEDVIAFIDKYISCSADNSIPTLINYQTHRHAKTCRKRGKCICRFGFPLPPMPCTVVLEPLGQRDDIQIHQKNYVKVAEFLDSVHRKGINMSFVQFLEQISLTYEEYILSIRSSIQSSKVFVKRQVSEVRINSYNSTLLRSWEANMDIQYILNPYACVSYIVSYISKGQRGLSNLLMESCSQAKENLNDIRQQVRHIGNTFLSHVEIGAQEAVYLVLQLPLRRCSRDVVHVDTNSLEKRTVLLKSFSDLKSMPVTSKQVEMDSVLKRYSRRPVCLENVCYAEFASWYDLCPRPRKEQMNKKNDDAELPETEYVHDNVDEMPVKETCDLQNKIVYRDGTCIRRRKQPKVIYWHCTPINDDKEEHFREQIMLYTNWRDEERDLLRSFQTHEQYYQHISFDVNIKKQAFEQIHNEQLDSLLNDQSEYDIYQNVNSEGQHQDLIDVEEGQTTSRDFGCFDPGVGSSIQHEQYDIGQDIGIGRKQITEDLLLSGEVDNDDFLEMANQLNDKQNVFFMNVLHWIKTKSEPLYVFLSGGAGVGKSVLLRVLYQAALKFFKHKRDEDPDSTQILLCAPTGKAAHNIGGCTIHAAFCVPANQSYAFKPLDMQQLNSMRCKYHCLKMLYIDEISMVGRGLFNFINLRLQEIMGSSKPFGGVSVLAFGDLFQLPPVKDSWIFSLKCNLPDITNLGIHIWRDYFMFFELTEVMRQRDDLSFALLLNRLREGNHTDEDLCTLESRLLSNLSISQEAQREMLHLFCNRDPVFAHNRNILLSIPEVDKVIIEAIDIVSGNLSDSLHTSILNRVPTDPSKTMGLQKKLELGLGLPAELCVNIDTADGLTNGASCILKKFDYRVENSERCSIVWVEFISTSIGQRCRTKYKHLYNNDIPLSWTPVFETSRKFTIQFFKTYLIARRQFPLNLAAAKTIHKSQGSTLQKAILHFGHRKVNHMHYVGLSRLTNLSGLYITELNKLKIGLCNNVVDEMLRLRHEMPMKFCVPDLTIISASKIKICFQNCRSLRKHHANIKKQPNFLVSDILAFVECRVTFPLHQDLDIEGFYSFCAKREESEHGIVVYSKVPCLNWKAFTVLGIECVIVKWDSMIYLVFVYCPPRFAKVCHMESFISRINRIVTNDENIILMGDFNQNYPSSMSRLLESKGFSQLISSVTTDYSSCLDHIYVNFPVDDTCMYGTLESHYSDHKPLFFAFGR